MKKINTVTVQLVLLSALLTSLIVPASKEALRSPDLTRQFYAYNGNHPAWMQNDGSHSNKRQQLIHFIDSCSYLGLDPARYQIGILKAIAALKYDTAELSLRGDQYFTDAALSVARDLLTGDIAQRPVGYDQLSSLCTSKDARSIISQLANADDAISLSLFLHGLEPTGRAYQLLKRELAVQIDSGNTRNIRSLKTAMNYERWIGHFRFKQYIVVNIPPATLRYYQEDSLLLSMKAVVGKPATRTPRFAAYCDQVILYPYWNVPASIVPELLRVIKKDQAILKIMGLQVVDKKGNVINPRAVSWRQYNGNNFPYRLRQSTGCGNALGVIKFNLTSPYGVYLHDTNLKPVFGLNNRYFSHGCIRIENPVALGNYLLPNKIDESFLAACLKNQQPIYLDIPEPVPVFCIYAPCAINDSGEVEYFRDIYRLF